MRLLADQACQRATALDRIGDGLGVNVVAEELERPGYERVCVGVAVLARALGVGAPAVDLGRARVPLRLQRVQEVAQQGRLAGAANGVQHDGVGLGGGVAALVAAGPGIEQGFEFSVAADQMRGAGRQAFEPDVVGGYARGR